MSFIANSWTITKHSLAVLKERKILLVFPVIGWLAWLVFLFGAILPVLLNISVFDIANAFSDPDYNFTAATEQWSDDVEGSLSDATPLELTGLLVGFLLRLYSLYFLGIFVMTFLHVATISEILNAFNGGKVSISRGLKFACTRLKAIAVWTLFTGCVGIAIRFVLQWLPFAGSWVLALLGGVAWNVATLFVVPILIREPQTSNPLQFVQSSANLIRRTWGESLIALLGGPVLVVMPGLVLIYFIVEMILIAIVKVLALGSAWFVFDALASAVFILMLLFIPVGICLIAALCHVLYKIFFSGLYVYAAEGVPPGTFTAEEFDRSWVVRKKRP